MYTFVCLDPSLLPLMPLVVLLVSVLVPSFVARHPAAEFSLTNEQAIGYSAGGPPIAPAVTVKPVKELSRDFFHNMRDLQNCMEDFSQMHDAIVRLVVPRTNFSNEAQSSALFVVLFATCLFMSIAANIMPWRLIFLTAGWAVTCVGHPVVQRQLETAHKKHVQPQEEKAMTWVEKWVDRDVILDSAPESREVEIFELQRLSGAGEWEPWLFSASPYDPLSPGRIAAERPVGTRSRRRPAAAGLGMEREEVGAGPVEPRVGRGAHHHGRRDRDGGRAVGVRYLRRADGEDRRHRRLDAQ